MFKHICNNPEERARITSSWKLWNGLFNETELNTLNDYLATLEVERATTATSLFLEKQGQKSEQGARVSAVKFLTVIPETEWVFVRFNWVIEQMNHYYYGYDLNGYDGIQYGVYDSSELGRYDWHMDIALGDRLDNKFETRKLSLSMLLNEPGVDFEGGEFQINRGTDEAKVDTVTLKKGNIVAFPSFLLHRVKPVTKGIRRSLVIWVTGPKFK
jgi:PKHD-type hydroxylase